jgi:3-hydroxyacyl-CoA dehydrogenase/enoyl-CoA hydratase/3-hydroxybutyryl-CoA epimerase
MDLMLTGRTIRPKQALAMGLVDRLAPVEQLDKMAKQVALSAPPARSPKLLHRLLNSWLARPILAGQMRSQVARRARPDHYPAPYAMIELWQRHGGKGERAYEAEARSMAELLCTSTSRNLVRVFFLQDRLKSAAKAGGEPARHVHVVGAGVMGGDIATWCATRGLTVTLQDRAEQYVAPAIERARKFLEKRYPDQAKRDETLARLQPDVEGSGIANADVVIEAIFEDLNAKRELFARIEPKLKPSAVLATNTSSIVLEQLAQNLASPDRLIGLHFFNPVARMPLIEVIHAERTQPQKVQAGLAVARQIDKLAIACRRSPGFLISGDGSIMMNVQEFATIKRYNLPLKVVVFDNQALGMVRQWQELFFEKRFSEVDLSDNPDFARLAEAFEIPAITVRTREEVSGAIDALLNQPGPLFVHVLIDPLENVWPLVPPGKNNAQMMEASA